MDADAAPRTVDPRTVDTVAQELYGLHPDRFVAARDDAVADARAAGDRDLARAVGRLRRPTRAAWLANLLARERPEQLDGLLALAGDLARAQRTLDGGALRALSAQRRRLVAAMAREGGRLAARAGDNAAESVVRDLEGILDAALADPAMAAELRSGRLIHTVRYSGFGPAADPAGGAGGDGAGTSAVRAEDLAGPAGTVRGTPQGNDPREQGVGDRTAGAGADRSGQGGPEREQAAGDRTAGAGAGRSGKDDPEREQAERQRAERARLEQERLERERAERTRLVTEAERAEAAAHDRAQLCEADHRDAEATRADARASVADLVAALEAAREHERAAAAAVRDASAVAKESARAEGAAATRADRARARLAELTP